MIEEVRPTGLSGSGSPDRPGIESVDATPAPPYGDNPVFSGPDPSSGTGPDTGGADGEFPVRSTAMPSPPRRPRMVRSLVIGSVIALAGLLVVELSSHSGKGPAGPVVAVGGQAPGFTLPPLTGTTPVDLDALGKDVHHPVILNFFASWCTPCQKETPLLAKAAAAEQAEGGRVRFVGVDVNDPPADAVPFVHKAGIAYPVGVDQSFRVTSGLYGLDGLPRRSSSIRTARCSPTPSGRSTPASSDRG